MRKALMVLGALCVLTGATGCSSRSARGGGGGGGGGGGTPIDAGADVRRFAIGGEALGLAAGPVVLTLNGDERLTLSADGPFRFLTELDFGADYAVTMEAPPGASCTLGGASGRVDDVDVGDVVVECVARAYTPGVAYFGANDYIEYVAGDLPIILVAPHQGALAPDGMPVINTHIGDGGSQQGMVLTAAALTEMTDGGIPHQITNHLKSDRMNAARDKDEAAGDHPDARQAWDDFHGFIVDARDEVTRSWGKGHYFELHTNGWPEEWINIGLGVDGAHLNAGGQALVDRAALSTVRYLVEGEGADFLEILRGPTSLGGLLSTAGYEVVPSPAIPSPGEGGFFYAGWNTWEHGSRHGGAIDATHIETHWRYINNGAEPRAAYSRDLADSILTFMETHYSGLELRGLGR